MAEQGSSDNAFAAMSAVLVMSALGALTAGPPLYLRMQDEPFTASLATTIGTAMTVISLLVGYGVSRGLTSSRDRQYFGLTPLTFGRYCAKNAMRLWPLLIGWLVVAPLLSLACIRFALPEPGDDAAALRQRGIALCYTLSMWLTVAVPLHRRITRNRWATLWCWPQALLEVVPKRIAFRVTVGALLACVAGALIHARGGPTGEAVGRFSSAVWLLCSRVWEMGPTASCLILFTAFPFAALPEIALADSRIDPLALSGVLALLLGVLVWQLIAASRRWPVEMEAQAFEAWKERRAAVEARGDSRAWLRELVRSATAPPNMRLDLGGEAPPPRVTLTNPSGDPFAVITYGEMYVSGLPYSEKLPPEEQACRHYQFWRGKFRTLSHVRLASFAGLLLVPVILIPLVDTNWGDWAWKLRCILRLIALFLGLCLFFAHGNWVESRISNLSYNFALSPLRLPQLLRHLYSPRDLGQWILIDAGLSLALALCLGGGIHQALLICPILLVLRCSTFMSNCLLASIQPGKEDAPPALLVLIFVAAGWVYTALGEPMVRNATERVRGPMGLTLTEEFFAHMFSPTSALISLAGGFLALTILSIYTCLKLWRNGWQLVSLPHCRPPARKR